MDLDKIVQEIFLSELMQQIRQIGENRDNLSLWNFGKALEEHPELIPEPYRSQANYIKDIYKQRALLIQGIAEYFEEKISSSDFYLENLKDKEPSKNELPLLDLKK
ncbi:MAG: hypothetical protein JSR80_02460 [Verrucomicrobia bacterium]|nr:hypothetical protein [Verrucomicrobiota bacterium]